MTTQYRRVLTRGTPQFVVNMLSHFVMLIWGCLIMVEMKLLHLIDVLVVKELSLSLMITMMIY